MDMKGVGQRNCRNDAHQGIGRNFVWAAPEFGDGRGIDGPGLGRDSGGDLLVDEDFQKSDLIFYCLPSVTDTEPETMFQAPHQHRRNQQNALSRRQFYFGHSVSDLTIDRRHF